MITHIGSIDVGGYIDNYKGFLEKNLIPNVYK